MGEENNLIMTQNTLPETIRKNGHTYHACISNCGNYTKRKGGYCLKCYKEHLKTTKRKLIPHAVKFGADTPKQRKINYKYKPHPCKKCGKPVENIKIFCPECTRVLTNAIAEIKQNEIDARKEANQKRLQSKIKPVKKQVCSKSPNKTHFEIISGNIGTCKYCGRKKDYSKLIKPYLQGIGM